MNKIQMQTLFRVDIEQATITPFEGGVHDGLAYAVTRDDGGCEFAGPIGGAEIFLTAEDARKALIEALAKLVRYHSNKLRGYAAALAHTACAK